MVKCLEAISFLLYLFGFYPELEMATGLLFWARPGPCFLEKARPGPCFLEKARPGPPLPVKYICSAAPPGFRFGGTFYGVGIVGGPGGGAPQTPENFENFQKISQENCKKWIILGDFSKKLKNPALNFRALDEKTNCVGNF